MGKKLLMEFADTIRSFGQFDDIVSHVSPDERYFFRGEPKSNYALIPKIGRIINGNNKARFYWSEKSIFASKTVQ